MKRSGLADARRAHCWAVGPPCSSNRPAGERGAAEGGQCRMQACLLLGGHGDSWAPAQGVEEDDGRGIQTAPGARWIPFHFGREQDRNLPPSLSFSPSFPPVRPTGACLIIHIYLPLPFVYILRQRSRKCKDEKSRSGSLPVGINRTACRPVVSSWQHGALSPFLVQGLSTSRGRPGCAFRSEPDHRSPKNRRRQQRTVFAAYLSQVASLQSQAPKAK